MYVCIYITGRLQRGVLYGVATPQETEMYRVELRVARDERARAEEEVSKAQDCAIHATRGPKGIL